MEEDFPFYDETCKQFMDEDITFENAFSPSSPFSFTSFSGDAEIESSCDESMTNSPSVSSSSPYSSPGFPLTEPQIIAMQTSFNYIQPVIRTVETPNLSGSPNSPSASKNPFISQPSTKKRKLEQEKVELILPRDVLKKTSCEELDEQVKQVTDLRELTPAEEYAVSRQRRLIKNREYANNARTKKKQETETLREDNDRIINEKNALLQAVTQLQQENQRLTQENLQLRCMFGNMGIPCPIPSASFPTTSMMPNLPAATATPKTTINLNASASPSPLSYKMSNPPKTSYNPNMGMTTLVLFTIMFSFAVFTLPNAFSSIAGYDAFAQGATPSPATRRIFTNDGEVPAVPKTDLETQPTATDDANNPATGSVAGPPQAEEPRPAKNLTSSKPPPMKDEN